MSDWYIEKIENLQGPGQRGCVRGRGLYCLISTLFSGARLHKIGC